MAGCDGGYFCERCEEYVPSISESDLYLRYVLGELPTERLLTSPERHIRCYPAIAQYIVDESFPPVVDDDPDTDKRRLPAREVADRESLVTEAWRRLCDLPRLDLPLEEYLLPGLSPPSVSTPQEEPDRPLVHPDGRIFF